MKKALIIIMAILVLGCIGSCIADDTPDEKANTSSDVSTTSTVVSTQDTSSTTSEISSITASSNSTANSTVTSTQSKTESKPVVSKPAASSSTQTQKEAMVWIPSKPGKYHSKSNCSGMKTATQVSISKAKSLGYGPCSKCY